MGNRVFDVSYLINGLRWLAIFDNFDRWTVGLSLNVEFELLIVRR